MFRIFNPYTSEYWLDDRGVPAEYPSEAQAQVALGVGIMELEQQGTKLGTDEAVIVPSPKRFKNAVLIQAGACNPSGVARSLVAAIDEVNEEYRKAGKLGADTKTICADVAVRLICHQLAFLVGVYEVDNVPGEYTRTMREAQRNAGYTKID